MSWRTRSPRPRPPRGRHVSAVSRGASPSRSEWNRSRLRRRRRRRSRPDPPDCVSLKWAPRWLSPLKSVQKVYLTIDRFCSNWMVTWANPSVSLDTDGQSADARGISSILVAPFSIPKAPANVICMGICVRSSWCGAKTTGFYAHPVCTIRALCDVLMPCPLLLLLVPALVLVVTVTWRNQCSSLPNSLREFYPLPAAHKFNLPMSVHKSMQQNGNNSIQNTLTHTHTHTGEQGYCVCLWGERMIERGTRRMGQHVYDVWQTRSIR